MRLLPATKSRFGKTLPRRINMLKNLVSQLILHEQIVTTEGKARAIRPIMEMLIKNAKDNKSDLRTEAQNWTVNHQKTMPLLYGPLRARYQEKDEGFTRSYSLLHRKYRHASMAVVELVNGPRDTIQNLEKFKDELATFKETNGDLFAMDLDSMIQGVDSTPHGRLHKLKKEKKENLEQIQHILTEASKEKARYVMELFAKQATGQSIPKKHPEFWVT